MKVTLYTCESGDWIGFYVDNVLKTQGHSIRLKDAIRALGIEVEEIEVTDEEMEEQGCPEVL